LKTSRTLLLLANGFEILEASAFIDILGWNLTEGDKSTLLNTCGLSKHLKSSFNQNFSIDYLVNETNVNDFDALVIPGGFKDFNYYEQAYDESFLEVIRRFDKFNKIIASVCVGALPIAKSGVLKNRNATTYNKLEYRNSLINWGVNVINKPIVIDESIITSVGPSTATDVAFLLLEKLTSAENVQRVKKLMGYEI
jgi:4-methyl-5(b-hydroxyethyl)-thiazole monophosphate biosynthesis